MTTPPPQASPSRQSNIPANSRRSGPRVSLAAWSPANLTQRRHCGSPLERRTTAAGRHRPHLLGPNLNHRVPTPNTMADDAKESGSAVEGAAFADKSPLKPARKPTFLQKARWTAVERARRKGMSLRAIERELGIHRSTIKKYLDAEGPPTRRSPATPPAPSDTAPADTMKT